MVAGERVEVMENKVVRRLAVSSSVWLVGGRCVQAKRGAKSSEEAASLHIEHRTKTLAGRRGKSPSALRHSNDKRHTRRKSAAEMKSRLVWNVVGALVNDATDDKSDRNDDEKPEGRDRIAELHTT